MGTESWLKLLRSAVVTLAVALAACAPAAQPTTRESASPGVSPAAPAEGTAGDRTPATASADGWEQTVAAARREARLTIIGHPSSEIREALTEGFQRRYPEIKVEYNSMSGPQVGSRVFNERQAGQYLVDLVFAGTSTAMTLIEGNAADPMPRYLGGPETRDLSKWMGGKLDFSDEGEQYNVVFVYNLNTLVAYNPNLVARGEIQSYWDLLNPKWRGRMVMFDPRVLGKSATFAAFLYGAEGLGKEYLVQLFDQNIALSRDERQVLDWVVRGQYALGLAPSESAATELRNKGVVVELLGANDLKEGTYLGPGNGTVTVVNQAPHPNAVRVYLDYLLSAEGQLAFSKAGGYPSRRMDVPTDHLPPMMLMREGMHYPEFYKEARLKLTPQVIDYLKTIIR
jgi:ABC-type Fe3+ transport system substrate-binding protein